jgi:EAL domain-containing protein (putative c-di-GMP-specific phosphodiesterase class I)
MLADLINRLLGKQGNERGIRTRVDDGSRPAERGNPARALPPPTLCLVVNARHDNRAQILEGLREAGVHAEEVPSIEKLGDFATRPSPDMVICEVDAQSDFDETLRALDRVAYSGIVQPVEQRPGDLSQTVPLAPTGFRTLPPLATPVTKDAIRGLAEVQGLARTQGGEVAISLNVAFKNGWVEFFYQPKIDLRKRMLVGMEVLARVRHPTAGILRPSSFLHQASHLELRRLGLASIRSALSGWTPFKRVGFNVLLSVNMPLATLDRSEIADLLRSRRPNDHRWPGLLIEMDVAEVVCAVPEVREFATRAREENIHLSIDRFRPTDIFNPVLPTIPIAEIKLAREFVLGVSRNLAMRKSCRAFVDFAHAHRATALAAGLENADDLSSVRKLGFDVGQGNILGVPMRKSDMAALLQRRATTKGPSPIGQPA